MISELTVSVIIPVFNGESCIQNALRSVREQTFHVQEVIVVNDGSSDRTLTKLEAHVDVIVINQANGGPAKARNAGINRATSPILAFLDADDLWPADRLAGMVPLFETDPDIEVVRGWVGRLEGLTPKEAAVGPENLYPFNITSAIYRKGVFASVGLFSEDQNVRGVEDLDWFLRARRVGIKSARYEKVSVWYSGKHLSSDVEIVNRGILASVRNKLNADRVGHE